MSINILQYEKDVWKTADLLIASGIKQSDFPKYMMPFFALLMVESRLVREAKKLKEEIGDIEIEDFIDMFQLEGLGYNDFVIRKNKTLKDICKNDKTFDVDFHSYLKAFDPETKYLLGVDKGTEEEKFLDISGISGLLKKKRILFETVQAWSEIDLTPYNNSEITTLEEHIKRKWADISAETAGEQYTPDDIISLITDIIASKIEDNDKFLTIYDPTCGGGNLLFGVEDKIKENFKRPTATYGEDWNDSLYALAKIESRFRVGSQIEHGNTLTEIKFIEKKFDVIVANPPYGVDWKGYQKDIVNDTTERFVALPSISDGQFLFTQHILYQLADDGLAVVVHNGSTLFSGDAGSGESAIRKHFLDNDWVEAIIQMPTDEFFNTGIYTYLWIFNKNKPSNRKDKVILINAANLFVPLKKSKGKKRKQMSEENRIEIVKAFTEFKENEYCKIFDKWQFYFNKQSIILTNVDVDGKSVEMPNKVDRNGEVKEEKSIKLEPKTIAILDNFKENGMKAINEMVITKFEDKNYSSLANYYEDYFKSFVNDFDYKDDAFVLIDKQGNSFHYNDEKETIVVKDKDQKESYLGNGKIVIKSTYKKKTSTKEEHILVTAEITKDFQKDFEIVPFNPNEEQNRKDIDNFMSKYVKKPFEYLENVIGVEINFNKIYYKNYSQFDVNKTLAEIESLEKLIYNEKKSINELLKKGLNNSELKDTNLGFKVPKDWLMFRLKDLGYLYSGLSGKSGEDFNQDENINNKGFIPFTNISNNVYLKKDHLGTVVVYDYERQNKVKKEDIFFLMSSEGYEDIGKTAILDDDLSDTYLNSFCKGFRVTKKNIVNPYFLNYLLLSDNYRHLIIVEGKGFTRINLKMEKINNFFVYLPPTIEEQNDIVKKLYTKSSEIKEIEKNINNQIIKLEFLKKALLNEVTSGNYSL
jgi:type I restriction enzyme M protein